MTINTKIIMSAEDIELALKRIALQVLEKNHNVQEMAVVGIHTCGVFLADRIVHILCEMSKGKVDSGSLDITLYRDDWSLISQSPVVKTTDISFPVEGKKIILVDDVLFTGRTIRAAMDALMDYGRPHSIQLVTLIDRGGRELPIQPDYHGLKINVRDNERIQVNMKEKHGKDEVVIES